MPQGNIREKINKIFKVRELLANSVICRGKMKFCKTVREMSGNFTNQPDEVRMSCPGPSCSKLTTSLVNDWLKFTLSDTQIR